MISQNFHNSLFSFLKQKILVMLCSPSDTVDSYSQLLDDFHSHEQELCLNQLFVELIDEIRIEKMEKHSLKKRKIEEHNKLMQLNNKLNPKNNLSPPKPEEGKGTKEKNMLCNEMQESVLKKEIEQVMQSLIHLKKVINEAESQLKVFRNKDDEINQLLYCSKREMDAAHNEIRNEKILFNKLEAKYEKQVEALQLQKRNIERENRYLVDCHEQQKKVNINAMLKGAFGNLGYSGEADYSEYLLEEIYSKRQMEQNLRALYLVLCCKSEWTGQGFSKPLPQLEKEICSTMRSPEQFRFDSKLQIMGEYQDRVKMSSFEALSHKIGQFYHNIRSNIYRNEKVAHQSNEVFHQLQNELEELEETLTKIEKNKEKNVLLELIELGRNNEHCKEKIGNLSRQILKFLNKKLNDFLRFKRIIETMNSIILGENQKSNEVIKPIAMRRMCKAKVKTIYESRREIQLEDSRKARNCIIPASYDPKGSSLSQVDKESLLPIFERLLTRSLEETVVQWYDKMASDSDRQGTSFLKSILNNDLYRIFSWPSDYDPTEDAITNLQRCSKKAFDSALLIDQQLTKKMKDKIVEVLGEGKEIKKKMRRQGRDQTTFNNGQSDNQIRYEVESRGYFRRDNFRLLEKLQLNELRNKGQEILLKSNLDISDEFITVKTINKRLARPEKSSNGKTMNFEHRKQRLSTPDTHNYLSSNRQKLNKADRKIRDLIKNAESIKANRNAYRMSVKSRGMSLISNSRIKKISTKN